MSPKPMKDIREETDAMTAPVETNEPEFRELFRFPKNKREVILCALREYKGRGFADLRVWYRGDETGALKPTAKGIAVRPSALGDLARQLAEAAERLGAEGARR